MSGRGVPRIYETIAKTEIGRKFEQSRREPSLNNGATLATFQACENTPEEMLRLKTVVSEFEIAEAALLRKQPSAPSNPTALFDFSRERLDSTSCSLIGGMSGGIVKTRAH